jgi:hypothetical protein
MPLKQLALTFCLLLIPFSARSQQTTIQSPQAVALLQSTLAAMGGSAPADSVATGTVSVTLGSLSETGTVRISTRGTDESMEQFTTPSRQRTVIFSKGLGNENVGSEVQTLHLERSVTSQSPLFPLPIVSGLLSNPDVSIQYVGVESLNNASVQHLRVWNTFASKPTWQNLTPFTNTDIWLDAVSNLIVKISFLQRDKGGNATQGIPIDVYYSDYQNTSGILYPMSVNESLNGTPWMLIQINNVALNTGLTDANFPIVLGAQ